MNGHDRHEDNILPSEILPEDHPATPGAQMETRTRVILDGSSQLGQPVVDRIETTGLDGGRMVESVEIRLTHAACGHVIHTGSELGSASPDGLLLCSVCAANPENICRTCRRPVAGPRQQRSWFGPEGTIQCRECRNRERVKDLFIVAVVVVAVILVALGVVGAIHQIRIPF